MKFSRVCGIVNKNGDCSPSSGIENNLERLFLLSIAPENSDDFHYAFVYLGSLMRIILMISRKDKLLIL
jgi:hypothetical protein